MPRMKVVFRKGAFAELRTLPSVMAALDKKAQAIASAAGPGYEAKSAKETGGRVRGRASVVATSRAAMRDAAKNGTLQRALSSGRG